MKASNSKASSADIIAAKNLIRGVVVPLEGGIVKLPGDGGGWTAYGLSERSHPYEVALAKKGLFDLTDAIDTYFDVYLKVISGWVELLNDAPWLLSLLFAGRIHGIGDNDYTALIQSHLKSKGVNLKVDGEWGPITASHFIALSETEKATVFSMLKENADSLVRSRQLAVSRNGTGRRYDRGIRNRVLNEFQIAARQFDIPIIGLEPLDVDRGPRVRINNASNSIKDSRVLGRAIRIS